MLYIFRQLLICRTVRGAQYGPPPVRTGAEVSAQQVARAVVARLDYRHSVDSVNRVRRFPRATLSGVAGTEALLATYSLVDAGIRIREAIGISF